MLTINKHTRLCFSDSLEYADIVQMLINLILGVTADKIVSDAPDTALGKVCVHRDAQIYIFNQQTFMLYSEMEKLHVNDVTSTDRYNCAMVSPCVTPEEILNDGTGGRH